MRFARACTLFAAVSLAALPAIAQNQTPGQTDSGANQMAPSGSYSALRDNLSAQSQALSTDVMAQRAILRRNQELLKEAQRLDATNKKMQAEKQHMLQQNAELERQRAALTHNAPDQTQSQSQTFAPAQPSTQGANADAQVAKVSAGDAK